MGKNVNWDDVPDSNVVPGGAYLLEISEMEETQTKAENGAKLMYKVTLLTLEPIQGMMLFENFVIGTDEDPDGDDPKSWKGISARRMKAFLKAAQIPLAGDMEEVCETAKGNQFVGKVVVTEDDGTRDPKYKGQLRNRITSYYAIGEKEPELEDDGGAQAAKPAAKKVTPAPAPKASAAAPKAAVAPGKVVKKAAPVPPPVEEEEEAPPPPPAPKKGGKAKAADLVGCGLCNEKVERSEYVAHITAHEAEE